MLIAIRYTDVDGKHEWATFGKFFYDFGKKKFTLEKQWIERTKNNLTAILTVRFDVIPTNDLFQRHVVREPEFAQCYLDLVHLLI